MNFYAAYIKWMTDWFTVATQVNNSAYKSAIKPPQTEQDKTIV